MAYFANEMIVKMKSLPEPYQSWAIEKIKNAEKKDWNSMGDFYMEVLTLCLQAETESEYKPRSKLNIFKRETHEEPLKYKPSFMLEYAMHMLERTVNESQRPILKEKIDEAVKMEWNNVDDFVNHCYKVYENITGVDITNTIQ